MAEITTWTNKHVVTANVLNPKVFHKIREMIANDAEVTSQKTIGVEQVVRISFENVKTTLGAKNLLFAMAVKFNGEDLEMNLVHVKAFDGWPEEITQELKGVEPAKENGEEESLSS